MPDRNYRSNYILNKLAVDGLVNIKDLAERLHVTEMTIRRDLRKLYQGNIISLIPGGATLKKNNNSASGEENYFIEKAESLMLEEKIKICRQAASLIKPNDVIIIDTGSTTENLSKFIPANMPVHIICYTLNVLFRIYKNTYWNLTFPGGHFHDDTMMFESPEGIKMIRKIRANISFISAAGVSEKLGLTCATPYEKNTKRAVIDSSDKRVLLVDSSKFGKIKMSHFAELSDFDTIITDSGITKEFKSIIKDSGINLYVV